MELIAHCFLPSSVISESNSTFEQEDYDDITEIKEEIQGRNKGEYA